MQGREQSTVQRGRWLVRMAKRRKRRRDLEMVRKAGQHAGEICTGSRMDRDKLDESSLSLKARYRFMKASEEPKRHWSHILSFSGIAGKLWLGGLVPPRER
jgi:hypothetical protein